MLNLRKIGLIFSLTLSLIGGGVQAQPSEYQFTFEVDSRAALDSLSKRISIDKVEGQRVWAYANTDEMAWFRQTGIGFELCPEKNAAKASYPMAKLVSEMQNLDRYPTYEVYDTLMRNFAHDYPQLCRLEVVATLPSGRQILAVKISKDVALDNTTKPEVLCTATMHGDEGICATTALNFCNFLLTNYGTDKRVNRLIDSVEFWIIPIFNPDGMYKGGNSSVSGSTRSNGNSKDLNRNFPSVSGGSNASQPETKAMMEFFGKHHFTLSTNLHAGNECFNYPWDTWSRVTADNDWWRLVGAAYRDTAQHYGSSGYFDDGCNNSANGLTNGYAWYSISGGQQDWANYYMHCREVTIEICGTKEPTSSATIANIWRYNKNSLLNFYAESLNGVRGSVTNAAGQPLSARITIAGHDKDNSWIETDARAGDYHRLLKAGTYNLTFEADGYLPQTVKTKVVDGKTTWLNVVILDKNLAPLKLETESIRFELPLNTSELKLFEVANTSNRKINYTIATESAPSWLKMNKLSGNIEANDSDTVGITADCQALPVGNYYTVIRFSSVSQTVHLNIGLDVIDNSPVTPAELTGISIATLPSKLEYKIGDTLSVDGGTLKLAYSNDSTAIIDIKREMIADFSSADAGTKLLTISHGGFTAMFSVIVRADSTQPQPQPIILQSVTISSLPTKLEYKIGDTLDVDGGTLKLTYSNDSIVTIGMKREMISNFSSADAGTKLLNVSLNGFVSVFSVIVLANDTIPTPPIVLQSVAISALPTKLEYKIGDTLNVDGGTLKLTYSNDSTAIVGMRREMVANFNSTTCGVKLLNVSLNGFVSVFSVVVHADSTPTQPTVLQSVSISTLPTKLEYKIGDTLNVDGGTLKLTYSNDSTAIVSMKREMISDFNNSTAGTKLLTVNFEGLVTIFSVKVMDNDTPILESESGTIIGVHGKVITIENAHSETIVYDLNGRTIATDSRSNAQISVPKAGIYIVKCGTVTKKIAIR